MKPISRRTILKGVGASLALPVLDAMVPRAAWAAPEQLVKNRAAFVFFPNGAIMKDWTPTQAGTSYELPKTLASLKDVQSDLLVITGLAHDKARANGDGAGDHARCSAAFLTAAQPRKTDGADISVGKSVDQVAAEKIGTETRLPSLELGIEAGRQAGRCDSGYSCAYQSNISWKSPNTPMAKEINPKLVFERLFGTGEDAKAAKERAFYRKSVLDFVSQDAKQLRDTLGADDRRKMDEYFTSVREIETRIDRSAQVDAERRPDIPCPDGIPSDWSDHVKMMYDLMALAFQTNTTRVCTFMLANSGSNRSYKELGVSEGHHQISHHRDDEEKVANLQKIDQYMVEHFAYFLKKLKATKEGNSNLLDNSMILYGCAISDANRHRHENLPMILAGRGGGTINPGRHLKYDSEVPASNLFLSMLDRMGVEEQRFGDSTGRAEQLS
ncbi:MAG: DUF1552 domain-containing protein [Planctomycetaceae bacterium]|nr:DUF1552 domain-containing protein [Planctomycetaceae bacterium]